MQNLRLVGGLGEVVIIMTKGIGGLLLKNNEWLRVTNYLIKSKSENQVASLPVYRHCHLLWMQSKRAEDKVWSVL